MRQHRGGHRCAQPASGDRLPSGGRDPIDPLDARPSRTRARSSSGSWRCSRRRSPRPTRRGRLRRVLLPGARVSHLREYPRVHDGARGPRARRLRHRPPQRRDAARHHPSAAPPHPPVQADAHLRAPAPAPSRGGSQAHRGLQHPSEPCRAPSRASSGPSPSGSAGARISSKRRATWRDSSSESARATASSSSVTSTRCPGSPVYRYLVEERGWVDAFAHRYKLSVEELASWPTAGFMRMRMHLDHVFAGGGLAVGGLRRDAPVRRSHGALPRPVGPRAHGRSLPDRAGQHDSASMTSRLALKVSSCRRPRPLPP